MHFEGETIVVAQGRTPRLARLALVLLGLALIFGPSLLIGQLVLSPETSGIGLAIGGGALVGFAIAGMMAMRSGLAPRQDLRFDPQSGLATIETHRLRGREVTSVPLTEIGAPWVERIRRPDMADDFTLHIPVAGREPLSVWHFETEQEAENWAGQIAALCRAVP